MELKRINNWEIIGYYESLEIIGYYEIGIMNIKYHFAFLVRVHYERSSGVPCMVDMNESSSVCISVLIVHISKPLNTEADARASKPEGGLGRHWPPILFH